MGLDLMVKRRELIHLKAVILIVVALRSRRGSVGWFSNDAIILQLIPVSIPWYYFGTSLLLKTKTTFKLIPKILKLV